MSEYDKRTDVLVQELHLSEIRAKEILQNENDTFWQGIATGSIILTPDQFAVLFSTDKIQAA